MCHLFESSSNLSKESLNHLVDALVTISGESFQLAYNDREPSLFAVAKLLETGIVNLGRVEVTWRATNSFHPNNRMRVGWGGCICPRTDLSEVSTQPSRHEQPQVADPAALPTGGVVSCPPPRHQGEAAGLCQAGASLLCRLDHPLLGYQGCSLQCFYSQ